MNCFATLSMSAPRVGSVEKKQRRNAQENRSHETDMLMNEAQASRERKSLRAGRAKGWTEWHGDW
jgi:hypothetical protein